MSSIFGGDTTAKPKDIAFDLGRNWREFSGNALDDCRFASAFTSLEELTADTGPVVEQANAGAIAKAIRKLAGGRELCRQMGLAAREHTEKFAWNKVASQRVELYDKTPN